MALVLTLGPLLLALLAGYWWDLRRLTAARIDLGLKWLTYLILGLIGYSIGSLDNLHDKLLTAGTSAAVLLGLIVSLNIGALTVSGRWLPPASSPQAITQPTAPPFSWGIFSDSLHTIGWVVIGGFCGYYLNDLLSGVESLVTGLLYILLFLIGRQLYLGNYRLRKLFLNPQGLIIAVTTLLSTWLAGLLGAYLLDLPLQHGLAVVSGFGWYSLSGILLTGLGDPVLGTTAFLLDISREILALMLIPLLSRLNSHASVGFCGATAMDFTLPMLGRFHGATIIPTAIASGFVMSLAVPVLIPLFYAL